MATSTRQTPAQPRARSYTRALKNARYLQKMAPHLFAKDPKAEGFGTGLTLELLRGLHRIPHTSPVLRGRQPVADFLRDHPLPKPGRAARDALFNGTIHFAQLTFQTSGGDKVLPTADMNQIVQYAQKAIAPICAYAVQYGPNSATVSSTLLTKTVSTPSGNFTDGDLQGWVNSLASDNGLPSNSCIFVVVPEGITANNVGGNAGYHAKANIPYVVAGVWATGLTLADVPDVYAMVVSHEIAEMVVDPNAGGGDPEVCDPCDINCGNLTRIYYDAAGNFLGSNQDTPPDGFPFTFYICAIVKPAGATDCPASAANCAYAPVAQSCELIIDKSTYGEDEVKVAASYPAAFWVAVDGFTGAQLNLNTAADLNNPAPNPAPVMTVSVDPTLNASLSAAQLATIGANLPSVSQLGPLPIVASDPTVAAMQRFLFPYTVSFATGDAFAALLTDQAAVLTLSTSFTAAGSTFTDTATLELVKGENPFYTNVNPLDANQPFWLSFDLRLFKVTVGAGGSTQRFDANMSSNAVDAPAFIASVIQNLTTGNGSAGGETFEGLAQDEEGSALEFLQQDAAGNFAFNFAVARVRLIGKTAGAQATNARVFFRLFQAQSTGTSFNEATTYRLASDGVFNGHKIPLLGIINDAGGTPEYVTVPCFASPRVNLNAPADMGTQTDPPNVQTIVVNPGIEVDTYFGCWLDINQPGQNFLPLSPPAGNPDGPWSGVTLGSINQAITRAPHQCLVAEIRYDDTPIPAGADAGTSDKLAQRNVAWIDGPNPGAINSRVMTHPIEIRPSSREAVVPDELMILWGDTPAGSAATLYLPTVSAVEVIRLAGQMYGRHRLTLQDAHTLRCPTSGATFVPIPVGTARNAGLLTVELPAGIRKGERYRVAVRQLTEVVFTPPPPPPVLTRDASASRDEAAQQYRWRQASGAFQFNIVISTKEHLLYREERLLAWLRWIFKSLPHASRWHPVWLRYLALIEGRVSGFGGDPGKIPPSPTGTVPKPSGEPGMPPPHPAPHRLEFTGKVVGLIHDRFGDFEGFLLLTEQGREHRFESHEHAIERLARGAWTERAVITVFAEQHHPHIVAAIVVRRAPEPFQH